MLREKNPHQETSRKEIARTFLELANSSYQEQRKHRPYYARIARTHGLTNQEIGEAYGVSEAAIRQMLNKGNK